MLIGVGVRAYVLLVKSRFVWVLDALQENGRPVSLMSTGCIPYLSAWLSLPGRRGPGGIRHTCRFYEDSEMVANTQPKIRIAGMMTR